MEGKRKTAENIELMRMKVKKYEKWKTDSMHMKKR